MAKAAPGFWMVWLWKSGMWGLVILFAFLYLGSIEKHRGDTGGDPVARTEPTAAADAGVGSDDNDVGVPIVELRTLTVEAGEERASAESIGSGEVDAPASAPRGMISEGLGEAANGQHGPVPDSVSQTEAQAFANAVMSDAGVESEGPGVLVEQRIQEAVPMVQPAMPSMSSATFGSAPTVAPSPGPRPDVSGSEVDAPRAAVRETAAQRRALIMAEYRAMQRAAQEEMRKRWPSMGGEYPNGAYRHRGYPQGVPPWGYAPAGQ